MENNEGESWYDWNVPGRVRPNQQEGFSAGNPDERRICDEKKKDSVSAPDGDYPNVTGSGSRLGGGRLPRCFQQHRRTGLHNLWQNRQVPPVPKRDRRSDPGGVYRKPDRGGGLLLRLRLPIQPDHPHGAVHLGGFFAGTDYNFFVFGQKTPRKTTVPRLSGW